MARGQDIRNAEKDVTDWGKWQAGGMTASTFQLSKRRGRSLQFGSAYKWRLVLFQAGGQSFRLLIAFNQAKQQYLATLALELDREMAIVASLEYHGTHPGWHVHAPCGPIDSIPTGSMRGPWQKRMPRTRTFNRRLEFEISDEGKALDVAAKFFRLHKKPGTLPV